MNKYFLISLMALAASSAAAAPLSPAEAWARAAGDSRLKAPSKVYDSTPAYIVKTTAATPAAYVFKASGDRGFMILSADDVAYPVLGYSDSGVFDPQNVPAQLQWWLDEYARMISWASENGLSSSNAPVVNPEWTAVEPLCSTKWNQSSPFNCECPIDSRNNKQSVTGCVATSMAQALKYFNYPLHGKGTVSYSASNVNEALTMNFSEVNFDWDNMLDVYEWGKYSDAQASAVGTLMKACGYAVNMNYGSDASGSQGKEIAMAFRTYFNIDGNCRTEYRMMYSMSDWQSKVYDNIKNIGPVIINGSDPGDAGHSFIVDGYDGNGYFHLNWGWGGISDGYFALDALNPDAMGIGGYGSGFNYTQNAIFGIQPPTGEPVVTPVPNLVQSGNLTASIVGSRLNLGTSDYYFYGYQGWMNNSDANVTGKFGVRFKSLSGSGEDIVDATFGNSTTISLVSYAIANAGLKIKANLPAVDDGKYKATLMFKPEGYDWQEIDVPWGYNNYVYLEKAGSNWTVSYPDKNQITISSASIASELYNGFNVLVKVTFVNNSDFELTQGLTPCLMSGETFKFLGPNILITLQPNETVEKDMIFIFNPLSSTSFVSPTEYTLRFINRETNVSYGDFGKYTMTTGPKSTILISKELSVANASQETMEYAQTNVSAFKVSDPSDFTVNFNYTVRVGYFDKIMKLSLYKVDSENFRNLVLVGGLNPIFSETPFLAKGEISENEVKVSFPDAEDGALYAIKAEYGGAGSWKELGMPIYFMKGTSGVDEIVVDSNDDSVEYYNLQGVKISNPVRGQVLIRRNGSKVEKVIL